MQVAVPQAVADELGQAPSLGNTLEDRIMGQTQVGFDHHGGEIRIFGIIFQHFGLGFGFGLPVNTVSTIDFLGDAIYAVTQLHFKRIEEFEFAFVVTGINDGIGEFKRAITTFFPMFGFGATGPGSFCRLAHNGTFRIGRTACAGCFDQS